MAKKLGVLAIAAVVMAYAPMAAWGCSGSSAQLNDGTKVAQGYGSSSAQPMPEPEPDEMAEAISFLERQARQPQASTHPSNHAAEHTALIDFCHVLLNSNEFLYVD